MDNIFGLYEKNDRVEKVPDLARPMTSQERADKIKQYNDQIALDENSIKGKWPKTFLDTSRAMTMGVGMGFYFGSRTIGLIHNGKYSFSWEPMMYTFGTLMFTAIGLGGTYYGVKDMRKLIKTKRRIKENKKIVKDLEYEPYG